MGFIYALLCNMISSTSAKKVLISETSQQYGPKMNSVLSIIIQNFIIIYSNRI
jgi:hypothetical protein